MQLGMGGINLYWFLRMCKIYSDLLGLKKSFIERSREAAVQGGGEGREYCHLIREKITPHKPLPYLPRPPNPSVAGPAGHIVYIVHPGTVARSLQLYSRSNQKVLPIYEKVWPICNKV